MKKRISVSRDLLERINRVFFEMFFMENVKLSEELRQKALLLEEELKKKLERK